MTRVKVASKNLVKLNGIHKAFSRYFEDIEIISEEVKSGVPDQPIDNDVIKGAKNRLIALKNDDINKKYDYFVSCEAGLISIAGHWFNVQVVIVEDQEGNQGLGMSQGFEIPSKLVEDAINTSVAKVLDKKFDGKGGISVLTRGSETRESLVQDGTIMALAKVLNSEVW